MTKKECQVSLVIYLAITTFCSVAEGMESIIRTSKIISPINIVRLNILVNKDLNCLVTSVPHRYQANDIPLKMQDIFSLPCCLTCLLSYYQCK